MINIIPLINTLVDLSQLIFWRMIAALTESGLRHRPKLAIFLPYLPLFAYACAAFLLGCLVGQFALHILK